MLGHYGDRKDFRKMLVWSWLDPKRNVSWKGKTENCFKQSRRAQVQASYWGGSLSSSGTGSPWATGRRENPSHFFLIFPSNSHALPTFSRAVHSLSTLVTSTRYLADYPLLTWAALAGAPQGPQPLHTQLSFLLTQVAPLYRVESLYHAGTLLRVTVILSSASS